MEGTPVDVFVEWGRKRLPLSQLIAEKNHAAPLLDFRYGGNEGPRWHIDMRDTRGFAARHPAGM